MYAAPVLFHQNSILMSYAFHIWDLSGFSWRIFSPVDEDLLQARRWHLRYFSSKAFPLSFSSMSLARSFSCCAMVSDFGSMIEPSLLVLPPPNPLYLLLSTPLDSLQPPKPPGPSDPPNNPYLRSFGSFNTSDQVFSLRVFTPTSQLCSSESTLSPLLSTWG